MIVEKVVACHHCDLLMDPPRIIAGEYAHCPRCHHKITRLHHNAINNLFSFAITGLILLILTTQFDLLILNLNGNISGLDLWDGASQLYFGDYKILSVLIILCIFYFINKNRYRLCYANHLIAPYFFYDALGDG